MNVLQRHRVTTARAVPAAGSDRASRTVRKCLCHAVDADAALAAARRDGDDDRPADDFAETRPAAFLFDDPSDDLLAAA